MLVSSILVGPHVPVTASVASRHDRPTTRGVIKAVTPLASPSLDVAPPSTTSYLASYLTASAASPALTRRPLSQTGSVSAVSSYSAFPSVAGADRSNTLDAGVPTRAPPSSSLFAVPAFRLPSANEDDEGLLRTPKQTAVRTSG